MSSTACGADRVYNSASASTRAAAATTSNYDSVCCVAKTTCSSHTCSAGMKKKDSISDFKCSMLGCNDNECCQADNARCYGLASMMSMGGCTSATGCSSCPSGKYYNPQSKNGVTSTSTDFEANCCTAVATCGDVTCAAWEMKKSSTTDATQCSMGTASCSCCEDNTAKCKGAKAHLSTTAAQQCAASEFEDPAKYAMAVSAAADWKSTCCTASTTCQSFKDHVPDQASGVDKMQKPEGVLFLVIGGLLALAK